MIVDSHCHLDMIQGDNPETLATRAAEAGVGHMLCVSVDPDKFADLQVIADTVDHVSLSYGMHPTERPGEVPTVDEIVAGASHPAVVAIGETGLDYYHCKGDIRWQQQRFLNHIEAAKQLQKPLIIHSRDAREDTIAILREGGADQVGGVLHCFSETLEMAEAGIALGFYISFSGIVTFKNARELQAVAQAVPLSWMMIETDSPFLAPVPYRGKQNEPAYVHYVAEKIAELRGISYAEVAEATTANFQRCFGVELGI